MLKLFFNEQHNEPYLVHIINILTVFYVCWQYVFCREFIVLKESFLLLWNPHNPVIISLNIQTSTIMVCNKVIAHNKVIFSYFDFSYQNQIILVNSCILNDNLTLLSII